VASVAAFKAQRFKGVVGVAEAHHFEKLAHFVFVDEPLPQAALARAGGLQVVGNAAVQQKVRLTGEAQHVQAGVLAREGDAGEVDLRRHQRKRDCCPDLVDDARTPQGFASVC
jgi:hypothetical protein